MLERDNGGHHGLKENLSRLPCDIVFPPSMANYFGEEERLTLDGRRKMARLVFHEPGGLEYPENSMYNRSPGWQRIYMKDVSLCGVAFIHSEQLFPKENLRLIIPSPKSIRFGKIRQLVHIEVVRCNRLDQKCYDIGAKLVRGTEHDVNQEESSYSLVFSGSD